MAIDSKHPLYARLLPDWEVMSDTYQGERQIKEAGRKYLPPTSGQEADGMDLNQPGYMAYKAYLTRAVFHSYVSESVEAAIGTMHSKPPVIELPDVMEPLRERATAQNEGLEQLLRRINEMQLVTGRTGLMLDLPAKATIGEVLPYIATYEAKSIINWDDGAIGEKQNLNMVVLDESQYLRNQLLEWEFKQKFRVLVLGDPTINEPEGSKGVYRVGVFDQGEQFNVNAMLEPKYKGTSLEQIPFVFINSKDVVSDPDDPPQIGLAKLALAIYRGEADYRQALFMQGQDTLIVIGATNDTKLRVGANASINLPIGGDAKYVGVSSQGLPEMRSALENDKKRAQELSGQMLDTASRQKESGEALSIRVAAQSATLNQVALAGAEGLQRILRIAATWIGADPEKVIVKPNLDFANVKLAGQELGQFMGAKTMGAPLSNRTIHKIMQERGVTEMSYEEELAEIEAEEPLVGNDDLDPDPDEESNNE